MNYTAPTIEEIGSVRDLTQQLFNKVGFQLDTSQGQNTIGSFQPPHP